MHQVCKVSKAMLDPWWWDGLRSPRLHKHCSALWVVLGTRRRHSCCARVLLKLV
ncbi:TPA: hypothetical protein N0F65_005399 [Lagenidium giganteum]|uniref:Uncharacterized protein n=1 Tax=Lagenidium giganteum TaxID=4803 RepID=A0AAV2YXW7_9STRA|nr:TPA: hypothetical protein N0F65_005399 [Lagenidium giganteum]